MDNLQLDVGITLCIIHFQCWPVRPGLYSWQVSLYDQNEEVDSWNCIPEMIVATETHQHASDEWNGILKHASWLSDHSTD